MKNISSDNAHFIKTLVENGNFDSEADAIDEAVTLLREREEVRSNGADAAEDVSPSDLGRNLRAIRDRYVSRGGELLTIDEIDREVAERRGERYPRE